MEFKTILILKLDIGEFPKGNNPEDYEEYLAQSDHTIQECEILEVLQSEK